MAIETAPEPAGQPRVVPGAASRIVRAVLEGPTRPARLLALFPSAVYLAAADGTVLALVTADAVRLPPAVVLVADSAHTPLTALVRDGDAASCGAALLRIGRLRVGVARWWTPRHPYPPQDRAALRAGTTELRALFHKTAGRRLGLPHHCRATVTELARRTACGDRPAAVAAAEQLLGLGPGLTPSGDDVLSGFLLALRHLAPAAAAGRALNRPLRAGRTAAADDAAWLASRITALAPGRTTDLSAALLGHAARGDGCAQAVELINAVAGNSPVGPALARLLAVGHTSGADLGLGVLAGARAVLAHRPTR